MPKVLVANNSELLRHLAAPSFRRLDLDLFVVKSGDEALIAVQTERPALAVLDAEMQGVSGYEIARRIRDEGLGAKVVLVVGKRLNHEQMRKVADCGCDEVLIAPMSADELHDVVAIQLGMPRHGSQRFSVELYGDKIDPATRIDGTVTNLSVDGVRLVCKEPLAEGSTLTLRIVTENSEGTEPLVVRAKVIWAQPRDGQTVVGARSTACPWRCARAPGAPDPVGDRRDTERIRVVIKGDITEATIVRRPPPGRWSAASTSTCPRSRT